MVWTSIDSIIVKEIPYWLEVTSIVLTMILGFLSLALGVWSIFLAMDLKEKKSMRKIILEINLYFNNLKEFKKIELEKITDDNIFMFMTCQRKWDSIPFKYKKKY